MEKLFVTFFGAGLLKPAPGTWGSIAGAIIGLFVLIFAGEMTLFLMSILLFLISIKIVEKYEKMTSSHDNSEIVIDEIVGVWISMSIAASVNTVFNLNLPQIFGFNAISWLAIVLSVVFFRIFDILKPSIIGRIDREVKGALGVMLDDVIAGFFGGIAVLLVFGILAKLNLTHIVF